jgi:hypothetical protein
LVEKIPADALVTVTEIYTGASYEPVESEVLSDILIVADETKDAAFENTYNGGLISGGISAINKFEVEENTIYWIDQNGDRKQQTGPVPVEETFR